MKTHEDYIVEQLFGKTRDTQQIPIDKLKDFEEHPYKVQDNEDMKALIDSIREHGVLTPILIRPIQDNTYEIISGHRRVYACRKLNKVTIPSIIKDMSREEATIAMVDSNLHREQILPSERAFAYKMKLDAIKRQGERTDLTSMQVAQKLSSEVIAEKGNTSKDTVRRYIRLTKLVKPLLDMVDEGKISITPAERLSYLTEHEQLCVADLIEDMECTPSLSQATKLKELSSKQQLDADTLYEIMSKPKANQKEMLKLEMDKLREFFPDCMPKDMETIIFQILKDWKRNRERQRRFDREER